MLVGYDQPSCSNDEARCAAAASGDLNDAYLEMLSMRSARGDLLSSERSAAPMNWMLSAARRLTGRGPAA